MRRFLSTWLALLVIAVFALAILVCKPLLTRSAEASAQSDLNALLNAAFAQFNTAGTDAEAVSKVSEDNILAKARAAARFLAHDDALLQTDALVSLCELLSVSAIDVTDYEGTAVASSVTGRIGRNLASDPNTAWTQEVLNGESVERTHVDSVDRALLWGCVPRTDTDGFVLVQSLDTAILTAFDSTNPELVLSEFSFINDELTVASDPGDDAAYLLDGRYCVRRTERVAGETGELSLIASRSLGSVYVLRNAILLVLSVLGLICLFSALAVQFLLLRRRSGRSRIAFDKKPLLPASLADEDPLSEAEAALLLAGADESESPQPDDTQPSSDTTAQPDQQQDTAAADQVSAPLDQGSPLLSADAPDDAPPRRKRKRKQREKLFELVPVEPDEDEPQQESAAAADDAVPADIPDALEQAPSDDPAERLAGDAPDHTGNRRKRRPAKAEPTSAAMEERFDKIF